MMKLYQLELKLFWANRFNRWLLVAYFLTALAAVVMGHQTYERELERYAVAETDYQEKLDHYRELHAEGELQPGYMGYYLFHPVVQTPSLWTSLFRGERDENADHLRVRLLGLQTQMNVSDPANPDQQISGQFDLGFIWLYLLPLLVAAMGVNVLADERSSGRWPILQSQLPRAISIVFKKLLVPAVVLALTNLLILLSAVLITGLSLSWAVAGLAVLLLLYQLCWWLICGWIVMLNRNASFNYLSFISLWLLFSFVVPGLSYLYQIQQQSPGADAAIVFEQRQMMNDSWDRDKQADFAAYLERFPAWRDTAPLGDAFDWRWYYAMQHMSDVVVADHVNQRMTAKQTSYEQGRAVSWFSPVMAMQYGLNRLADADTVAHLDFSRQVMDYHSRMQDFIWSVLFFDKAFDKADFERMPSFDYEASGDSLFTQTLLKLLCLSLLFFGLSVWGLKRSNLR